MNGLWLERGQVSHRDNLPRPVPPAGEALVRVGLAGICGTDLAMIKGYSNYTGIPGHEFVGEVVEAEDTELTGQRVVGEINVPCGSCPTCRGGLPGHCPQRTVLGINGRPGCMAEYLVLPAANLHRVPGSLSDEAAVFCELLAAAVQIQQQVPIRPEHSVLVVGAGRLGQLIARVLKLTGCRLSVVARHPKQWERLREAAIVVVEAERVGERSADIVVEASGNPSGFELAAHAVRPRGTIVLKSTYAEPLPLVTGRIVVDEVTIVASRCGPFDKALGLLECGDVDPSPLIDARLPLSEGEHAFELASRSGALKVLLEV